MMVDGSPRRVSVANETQGNNKPPSTPPPPNSSNVPVPDDKGQWSGIRVRFQAGTEVSGTTATQQTGTTADEKSSTSATRTSRSRWLKLRTTVQLSGAITQVHKKPPLKREDSFLKRFSTRPIVEHSSACDGSAHPGDNLKGRLFGSWRSVINPDENILFYWLSLLTACLLYNAWTIIARQAFPELQQQIYPLWYAIDGFSDLVFALDIAFQFRTGYLEQGLMVCESKKLACHYFKSRPFVMDILAVTPLDMIQLHIGTFPLLRFPRFLKVYRSFRFYYMVESRTIYPNLWRVVNLIHILLLLAHWFGCFYYMLSELEGFNGEWSYPAPVDDYATLSRKYLGSVYWSTLTLTTIGDLATPVTNLQYLFTIVSYLIGVFIFATIVGQVGNVITNRNASRLEFERLLDGAKLYMRHHKVPRNMQRRVQRWYDYSWSRGRMQGGGDINSALGILPDKLKTELALHVNLKTLKKVSIFQECQPEFLHDLVLKMKAYIFTPGDLICRKGEVAREMFIIADGILEVISETGKVLTQMKAGDFFGEIGILNLDGFNRRTADVRSVGYSELFSLSREDILAAMKDYPEAQEILQTMGRKRLMEARMAATIGKPSKDEPQAQAKKGNAESGKKVTAQKPKTAVSKFKEDVRSLKKLLRSKSTPAGKEATVSEEQMELKRILPKESTEATSEQKKESGEKPAGRRNDSLRTLMRKIHFKGDSDSSLGKRGLADSLSNIRSRFRDSGRSSESKSKIETHQLVRNGGSSESSEGFQNTPLNKALPLLQRIRLLGEQERAAEQQQNASEDYKPLGPAPERAPTERVTRAESSPASTETCGEGLPLLERLKFLHSRDKTQQMSVKEENTSFTGSPITFSSRLCDSTQKSFHTSRAVPQATPARAEVKPWTSGLNRDKPEFQAKEPYSRASEGNEEELPLLKRVLLMKMMEDKRNLEHRSATTYAASASVPTPVHPECLPSSTRDAIGISRLSSESALSFKGSATSGNGNVEDSNSFPKVSSTSDSISTVLPSTTSSACQMEKPHFNDFTHTLPTTSSSNVSNHDNSTTDHAQHTYNPEGVCPFGLQRENTTSIISHRTTEIPDHTNDAQASSFSSSNKEQVSSPTHSSDDEAEKPTCKTRKDSTTAELLRSNTEEGYTARKGKLSRMLALHEDSDECGNPPKDEDSSDSSEDPFIKNIECQTEIHRSSSESSLSLTPSSLDSRFPRRKTKRVRDISKHRTFQESTEYEGDVPQDEESVQDILNKVVNDASRAMKVHMEGRNERLLNQLERLEKELREKDALIAKLQSRLDFFTRHEDIHDNEDQATSEESHPVFDSNRSMCHRKSWPSERIASVRRRQLFKTSRQSCSLDEEVTIVRSPYYKTEEMWKLEFPIQEGPDHVDGEEIGISVSSDHSSFHHNTENLNKATIVAEATAMECLISNVDTTEDVPDEYDLSGERITDEKNWEVQMLVQQFERNVRSARRHSSGEVLSWQKVFQDRHSLAERDGSAFEECHDETEAPLPTHRRKLSLFDDRLLSQRHSPLQTVTDTTTAELSADSQSSSFRSLNGLISPEEKLNHDETVCTLNKATRNVPEKKFPARRGLRRKRQNNLRQFRSATSVCKAGVFPTFVESSAWHRSFEEDALGDSQNNNSSSNISSGSVVDVDQRCRSMDDISHNASGQMTGRVYQQEPISLTSMTTRNDSPADTAIQEWPSSPCLPTITEDDTSTGPIDSSPCRSLSHDCIPTIPQAFIWPGPNDAQESNSSSNRSMSLPSGKRDRKEHVDSFISCGASKFVIKDSSGVNDRENRQSMTFAQNREETVVISIPECEALLSPQ